MCEHVSLGPSTLTGVLGGDMGEGLLWCCSQTLGFPFMGHQDGPIFGVLPQAGKDLSLQAGFSLMADGLRGFF